MHKPKTLITGVSGFVGTKLARKLLTDGHEVIGVDLKPCKELEGIHDYQFQEVDLTSWNSVDQLKLSGLDHVVHLAAAGVKAAGRQWPICVRVNIEGTANLVRKLLSEVERLEDTTVEREEGSHEFTNIPPLELQTRTPPSAKRVVPLFLYTKTWYEDHLEECEAFRENPYVVTKHAATKWIEALASLYPGSVAIAKVFQVYGPGDDPNNVLSYAARCIKNGEPATFGSGTQLRDWIYIDDFINGLVACLSFENNGLSHFDLGSGELHSLGEMIEILAELTLVGPTSKTSRPQLTFDVTKDRGDSKITDYAQQYPQNWSAMININQGLFHLLSSIV